MSGSASGFEALVGRQQTPDELFVGLTHLESLSVEEWPKLTTMQTETFSTTPRLSSLTLDPFPKLPRGPSREVGRLCIPITTDFRVEYYVYDYWKRKAGMSNGIPTIGIAQSNVKALSEYFGDGSSSLEESFPNGWHREG